MIGPALHLSVCTDPTPHPQLTLSAAVIDDNAAPGTTVGTLAFAGPGSWTFALTDNAGGLFTLAGATLRAGSGLDHAFTPFPSIRVEARIGSRAIARRFTINVRKALPAMPLSAGARIMGFGHSMIQRQAQSGPSGYQMYYGHARGALTWAEQSAERYNLDKFLQPLHPWATGVNNDLDGAHQAIGGRHLRGGAGTIGATPYVLARNPQLVYLHIGENDANTGLTGGAVPATVAEIIAAYKEQLVLLRNEGKPVIVQTLVHFGRASQGGSNPADLWADDDPRFAIVDAVNAWLVTLDGANGVRVCDTRHLFNEPARDRALFGSDNIHWSPAGGLAAWGVLRPILESMVANGSFHNTDWQTNNLWPSASLPGTAGTKSASGGALTPTGNVATGHSVTQGAGGQSTIVCSKETGAAGVWEKQVIAVTPVNSGGTARAHEVRLRLQAQPSLAGLGLSAGDWVAMMVYLELSDWPHWLEAELMARSYNGSTTLNFKYGGLENPDRATLNLPVPAGGFAGWIKLTPIQLPPDITNFELNVQPITVRFDRAGTGTGTIKISRPILRKLPGDPRTAWGGLPALA